MKVITAPNSYIPSKSDVLCFLAGGITGCYEWQKEVISYLEQAENSGIDLKHLVIANPRREDFPIDDLNAAEEQIEWEFILLEKTDIFSMYFTSGESIQPICLYELGRNLVRMADKYPLSWNDRLAISVENGYKRKQDVLIQCELALGKNLVLDHATPQAHAHNIIMCYTWATEDF